MFCKASTMDEYMQLVAEKIHEIGSDFRAFRNENNSQKAIENKKKDKLADDQEDDDKKWQESVELKSRAFFVKQIVEALAPESKNVKNSDSYKLNLLNAHVIKVLL